MSHLYFQWGEQEGGKNTTKRKKNPAGRTQASVQQLAVHAQMKLVFLHLGCPFMVTGCTRSNMSLNLGGGPKSRFDVVNFYRGTAHEMHHTVMGYISHKNLIKYHLQSQLNTLPP